MTSIVTTTVVPSVIVITSTVTSGIIQILPSCTESVPTGTYISTVTTTQTLGPLLSTVIPPPTTIISFAPYPTSQSVPVTGSSTWPSIPGYSTSSTTGSATSVSTPSYQTSSSSAASIPSYPTSSSSTISWSNSTMTSSNIFVPVETDAPPSNLGTRPDHPVPRLGIKQTSPIETNKFYANFFLGSQTAAAWTHPYSVAWSKGGGASSSWGLAVSHIDPLQRVFGPATSLGIASYFINPVGLQSMVLSAAELGPSTVLTTDRIAEFSTNVNLAPSDGAPSMITFPLVQGMAFVTGIYNGSTPILQTGIFFRSITKSATSPKRGVSKFIAVLNDGTTWLVYAYSPNGASLDFTVVNNGLAQATSNFQGIIQVAKSPNANAEALYDAACGSYPTSANLTGTVSNTTGSYTLSFNKAGVSNATLLMFALPHHLESFDSTTKAAVTNLTMATTTKGNATAVVADKWTMTETLPTDMGFAPWSPDLGSQGTISQTAIEAMASVAASEVSQNMSAQTDLNSMYYSGKVSRVTPRILKARLTHH